MQSDTVGDSGEWISGGVNLGEDAGVEVRVAVEVEETTFWERVSFWV